MSLLGFHVGALQLRDRNATLEQLKRTRSNWHLVMDDKSFAKELLPFTQKGIVYRAFDPFAEAGKSDFDNHLWRYHSAKELAQWMKANLGDMGAFYLTAGNNEPSTSRENRRQFIQWLVDLMHELKAVNLHGAIGEIAVAKTLEIDEIKLGWWDEFLKVLHQYRDWHIATFHEYSTGLIPANFIPNYPFNLLDKSIIDKSKWIEQIPLTGYPGNWHIGRWQWLRERAIEIGYPMERVVITECSYDIMIDPGSPGQFIEQKVKPMFPAGNFERMKGWVGHRPYWKWLLNNTSETAWQELMYDSVKWQALAYAPEVEGLCQFSLKSDWYEWEGVDLSHPDVTYFRDLVEHNPVVRKETPMPTPTSTPIETVSKRIKANATGVRIRKDKSTASPILGYLPMSYTDVRYSVQTWQNEGFVWRFIEIPMTDSDNVIRGFCADKFIEVFNPPSTDIVLTENEKHLIAAYREHDVANLLALLNMPLVVLLTEDEDELLTAYENRDIRRLLTYVLAITP